MSLVIRVFLFTFACAKLSVIRLSVSVLVLGDKSMPFSFFITALYTYGKILMLDEDSVTERDECALFRYNGTGQ